MFDTTIVQPLMTLQVINEISNGQFPRSVDDKLDIRKKKVGESRLYIGSGYT